jgi:hypothetical protein
MLMGTDALLLGHQLEAVGELEALALPDSMNGASARMEVSSAVNEEAAAEGCAGPCGRRVHLDLKRVKGWSSARG